MNRVFFLAFCLMITPLGAEPMPQIQVSTELHYVEVGPAELLPDAPVVVILHGTGATGDSMLSLCDQLQLPPCRFVLPDGPLRAHGAFEWYDRFTHDRKGILYSRDRLFELIDQVVRESAPKSTPGIKAKPRPVILIGFSQGAVMALETGLNYKGNVVGIVSLSGYIGDPEKTLAHPYADHKTPIFLMQGTEDPVVQEEMGQSTVEALRKAGYHPFMKRILMGHKISNLEIEEVSKFLREVILLYH